MSQTRQIIALNYMFSAEDYGNRIFAPERTDGKAPGMRAFREYIRRRGAEVVTLDTVDFNDPAVSHVLYFDHSWRFARTDPFLRRVPRAKRALVIMEPANANPSLYYTSLLRRQFTTVFTYDQDLLRRHPEYTKINVFSGADPMAYRSNPFQHLAFENKKLLIAVSSNRWSYMPQSSFNLRRKLYRHFDRTMPGQFDLYGGGWNAPCIGYERWLGYPVFAAFRGGIPGGGDGKVRTMSTYRFAFCIESNATQPGYVSEKIFDCFCARCVPIYYGWRGAGTLVPRDAFIDLRDFRRPADLEAYLRNMDAAQHARYVQAIDRFMAGDAIRGLTTENVFRIIADRLGLPAEPRDAGVPNPENLVNPVKNAIC